MTLTLYEQLAEPFPVENVFWRVGKVSPDKKRGMALAYINARDVMERLDQVCGPDGWQDEYTAIGEQTVCCRIGVRMLEGVSENWVWKADGAGETDYEGAKGKFSDAFKRAAVKHGIGRYLYNCSSPWVDLDDRGQIKKEAMPELNKELAKASNKMLWGDRSAYTTFRLLRSALETYTKSAADVDKFFVDNKGHIMQLRVGARQELENLASHMKKGFAA